MKYIWAVTLIFLLSSCGENEFENKDGHLYYSGNIRRLLGENKEFVTKYKHIIVENGWLSMTPSTGTKKYSGKAQVFTLPHSTCIGFEESDQQHLLCKAEKDFEEDEHTGYIKQEHHKIIKNSLYYRWSVGNGNTLGIDKISSEE